MLPHLALLVGTGAMPAGANRRGDDFGWRRFSFWGMMKINMI